MHYETRMRASEIFGCSGRSYSSTTTREAVPGSDHWEIIVTRPTDRSFRQRVFTLDQKVAVLRVLVIGQFEEFFVTSSEAEHQSLLAQLSDTGVGAV